MDNSIALYFFGQHIRFQKILAFDNCVYLQKKVSLSIILQNVHDFELLYNEKIKISDVFWMSNIN